MDNRGKFNVLNEYCGFYFERSRGDSGDLLFLAGMDYPNGLGSIRFFGYNKEVAIDDLYISFKHKLLILCKEIEA